MIRTLLAQHSALVRGALTFVLDAEDDIDVVAAIGRFEELVDAAVRHRPDVTVLDLDLVPDEPVPSGDLAGLRTLSSVLAGVQLLVLAETRQALVLGEVMASQRPGLSFLAKESPPERLVAAVRKVAGGDPLLDPELVVSAVRAQSPLTPREAQVLCVAAEGVPIQEVAARLMLSPGTVRNHLSRVIGKTGARTKIEAVRIAQDAGWI